MDYFAGLDVSMEETSICVVDREGIVVHEAKAASTPEAICSALGRAPQCRRVVFETGRMAPMLHHGLIDRGVPVICIETRQAYQALKSLGTHKTDRNDARGLEHLARTGFCWHKGFPRLRQRRWQTRHDPNRNYQGNTIADSAFGDLIA